MFSFENSFTQKVLLFLFTWGSASSRFHLEVPARIHLPSAKRFIFLQGYLARGTFSGSMLTGNCYCLYHFLLANLSCHVFLQHFFRLFASWVSYLAIFLLNWYAWNVLSVSSADLARVKRFFLCYFPKCWCSCTADMKGLQNHIDYLITLTWTLLIALAYMMQKV